MFTQKKRPSTPLRKLHSIHVLPSGKNFAGKIETGKVIYQFTFATASAELSNGKLKLKGRVTVQSPAGGKRTADNAVAALLSTQGSIQIAPSTPQALPEHLRPAVADSKAAAITDATDGLGSIGVMYLKLSPLDGNALGLPLDLSAVQINARLYPTSEIERDLQWLYSAWLLASDEQMANGYLAEINRILRA